MANKTKFEEKHPNWEWECIKYSQKRNNIINEINSFEIAFGNIREDVVNRMLNGGKDDDFFLP